MNILIKRIIKYIYFNFIKKNKVAIAFNSNVDLISTFGINCTLLKNSRVSNSEIGNEVSLGNSVRIKTSKLDDKVSVHDNTVIVKSNIGSYTYVSKDSNLNMVTIGKFCSLGQQVIIGLGMHPTNYLSTSPFFYSPSKQYSFISSSYKQTFEEYKDIWIGNDVWIGTRAIILDGVTIGNGAIIAAGSVVTKDVESYSIVGGIPAKFIKKRFNSDVINKLQELVWWNWTNDEILQHIELFQQNDININDLNMLQQVTSNL